MLTPAGVPLKPFSGPDTGSRSIRPVRSGGRRPLLLQPRSRASWTDAQSPSGPVLPWKTVAGRLGRREQADLHGRPGDRAAGDGELRAHPHVDPPARDELGSGREREVDLLGTPFRREVVEDDLVQGAVAGDPGRVGRRVRGAATETGFPGPLRWASGLPDATRRASSPPGCAPSRPAHRSSRRGSPRSRSDAAAPSDPGGCGRPPRCAATPRTASASRRGSPRPRTRRTRCRGEAPRGPQSGCGRPGRDA